MAKRHIPRFGQRQRAQDVLAAALAELGDPAGALRAMRRQRELLTESRRRRAEAAAAIRARDFIDERFRERIRLQDLCAHVGVGLRTLQRTFSSVFGVSPLAYIGARRLHAARRDLMQADPAELSVTEAGLRNGFSNLGRFAVRYRAHFGESPSDTLRQPVRRVR